MILDITLRSYIGDLMVDACVTPVKAHTLVQRDRAHRNESRLLSEHTLRHVLEPLKTNENKCPNAITQLPCGHSWVGHSVSGTFLVLEIGRPVSMSQSSCGPSKSS